MLNSQQDLAADPSISYITSEKLSKIAIWLEHPLQKREVVGSIQGHIKPKTLKMVPVSTLNGAQHYKAFSRHKYMYCMSTKIGQKSLSEYKV